MSDIELPPIEINVISTTNNGANPEIRLRRSTTDYDLIKIIVTAALNDLDLKIKPKFTNKYKSIASLIENGILYQENGEYYFNF